MTYSCSGPFCKHAYKIELADELNSMTKYFILVFGISVSFFVIVLLLKKLEKKLSDHILILWFSISLIHLGYFFLGFRNMVSGNHFLLAIGHSLPVLHIFLNSVYINVLRSKSVFPLVYIYGTILILYIASFYYMSSSGSILQEGLFLRYSSVADAWTYLVPPSFLLVYLFTGIHIIRSIRIYSINLKTLYSNSIHGNVLWLGYWFWSYVIGSFIIITIMLSTDFKLVTVNTAYVVVSLVLSFQVFFLGQLGASKNFTFDYAPDRSQKYASSGLKEHQKEVLKQRLMDYLDASQVFLNPKLSLHDLAKGIGLPSYQISQLINESLQTSFYDLINKYRLDEFKKRVNQPQYAHLSILGLALDCGFNSKSGFYKVFKKHTGISPSQYKKGLF